MRLNFEAQVAVCKYDDDNPPFFGSQSMPKIVSQSTVSSSDQQDHHQNPLHVYYCLCSEFILVIDAELQKLPRRKTDGAYILANARRIYKLTAVDGESIIIKRFFILFV